MATPKEETKKEEPKKEEEEKKEEPKKEEAAKKEEAKPAEGEEAAKAAPAAKKPEEKEVKGTPIEYLAPFPITGPKVEAKGFVYREYAQADFYSFRMMCEDLSGGWVKKYEKDGVYSWTKSIKGESFDLIRVFGVLPEVPPSLLYDVLHDSKYRSQWDANLLEAFRVQKLCNHCDVGYYSAKISAFVSDREFLNQRGWMNFGDGEYIIFNSCVQHPDVPGTRKSRVRAKSKVAGYCLRPWGDKGCTLSYISQTDPQGWIPAAFVNYLAEKMAPDVVNKLTNACGKYPEWVKKQTGHTKDWLTEPQPWPSKPKDILHEMHNEKVAAAKAAAAKK